MLRQLQCAQRWAANNVQGSFCKLHINKAEIFKNCPLKMCKSVGLQTKVSLFSYSLSEQQSEATEVNMKEQLKK